MQNTLTLNNGIKMPLVGHGLWKIPNDKIADQVYNAIKIGYRLFDGACGKYFLIPPNLLTFQITETKKQLAKVLQELSRKVSLYVKNSSSCQNFGTLSMTKRMSNQYVGDN
jgi:hypothetical protein